MDKLKMISKNLVDEKTEILKSIMPNIFVSANDGLKIDYELFKQELSKHLIDGTKERYQLNWPGSYNLQPKC